MFKQLIENFEIDVECPHNPYLGGRSYQPDQAFFQRQNSAMKNGLVQSNTRQVGH